MLSVIGIDPGSRVTGYGIIRCQGQKIQHLAHGCIKIDSEDWSSRLHEIFAGLTKVIHQYHPEHAAIEQVFMSQNANSAIKLGQARGAAIVAVAEHGLPLAEYAARQVKRAVVGYGAATKQQIQHMMKQLMGLPELPPADAADALAIALCHAHSFECTKRLQRAQVKS